MRTLALVTCTAEYRWTPDDALTVDPLTRAGFAVRPVVWNDPQVRWQDFDTVVLRSCWDYHLDPERFRAWLGRLDAARVDVRNPTALVRWNLDKTYLRELAGRGVEIPRTAWLPADRPVELRRVLAEEGFERAVVKPTISASAWKTTVTTPASAGEDQARLDDVLRSGGAMVQRFVPEVAADGEWSLVFLAGRFSHAVLKRARPGEFRVQTDFGGSAELRDPPADFVRCAAGIVAGLDPAPLYARVDGVGVEGRFVLLELELIEPELFFRLDSTAVDRFVEALA